METALSPVIEHLRSFQKNKNRRPQSANGDRTKLTKAFAQRFCDTIAETDQSLFQIIEQNPDFPHHKKLFNWQQTVPWFADMWKAARIRQTHYLAQLCLKLANSAQPKTAHVVRVQFDIYKWYMAKFNPDTFADKPALPPVQTVNVGIAINPERLSELRTKLDSTRATFSPKALPENKSSTVQSVSPTCGSVHPKRVIHPKTDA